MNKYIISIYDIKDITNPRFLEDVVVEAESKADAADLGHKIAEEKYPKFNRMVQCRK